MSPADQLYDQAVALKEQNQLDAAVAKLREVLALQETHVLAHSALAVYLQKLGQPDAAMQHAIRVTQLEPNDPFSFTQLSVIAVRCGKIQEAEDAKAKAHMLSGHHHH